MSRFMKYASVAGKQVPINMATELQYAGYRRVIDAVDQTILNETVDKVKSALENNKLLSATQASSTSSVTITSMPHPSDQDPEEHSTVLMQDSQGVEVAKGHVTTDESKQEIAR